MKEADMKQKLSPAQVSVMLHKVTEPPYFGKYWDHVDAGVYRCAACDTPLFSSDEKFDSKTGWPSFKKPINEKDLQFKGETGPDDKVEIRCKKCKSHLGYVIAGEHPYYRINSVCLHFVASAPSPIVSGATNPTEDVKQPVVFPTAATLEVLPETDSSSRLRGIVPGVIIGLLIGIGGSWLVLGNTRKPVTPEIATSTTATSTLETESGTPTPQAAADTGPAAVEVVSEPDIVETAQDGGATSTQ